MHRIEKGKHVVHRNRLHFALPEIPGGRAHIVLAERRNDAAVAIHAFFHSPNQRLRDDRIGWCFFRGEGIAFDPAARVQDVAKPFGRKVRSPGKIPRDDGVSGDGGAVDDQRHLGKIAVKWNVMTYRKLVQARQNAFSRTLRRRRGLDDLDRARSIDFQEIGKGTADINPENATHGSFALVSPAIRPRRLIIMMAERLAPPTVGDMRRAWISYQIPPYNSSLPGSTIATSLARIIHIFEDNKSLLCYKHVD